MKTVKIIPGSGGKRKTTHTVEKVLSISQRTIQYRLNEGGYRGRVARKKPLVKNINR
jgi:hypothetical protein